MTDAARQAAALAPTASGGKERNGDAVSGARRRPRVLVVDDHPQICQLIDAVLGSVGFDVVAASGQDAALAAAAASEFDVVVVVVVGDVHMPGMSGPELYATLLRLRPRLPVVFMSAGATAAELPAGAALLRKPFRRARGGGERRGHRRGWRKRRSGADAVVAAARHSQARSRRFPGSFQVRGRRS